jgi:hypothetical protein
MIGNTAQMRDSKLLSAFSAVAVDILVETHAQLTNGIEPKLLFESKDFDIWRDSRGDSRPQILFGCASVNRQTDI